MTISSKLIPGSSKKDQFINAVTNDCELLEENFDLVRISTCLPIDAIANLPMPFSPVIGLLSLLGSIGGRLE